MLNFYVTTKVLFHVHKLSNFSKWGIPMLSISYMERFSTFDNQSRYSHVHGLEYWLYVSAYWSVTVDIVKNTPYSRYIMVVLVICCANI